MNNRSHESSMLASRQQAQTLGLTGTPSIIVNGTLMPNPDDYNSIKAAIEAAAGS